MASEAGPMAVEVPEGRGPMAALDGKLVEIQRDLKVEKGQFNKFGGYSYRSKEDILEAVKPLAHERGCVVLCDDEVVTVGGWVYVRATASLVDAVTGASESAHGMAREPEAKKGMDASQITGTASSYAGKRALGNLFAIDDTKDADGLGGAPQVRQPPEEGPFTVRCQNCGRTYQMPDRATYDMLRHDPSACGCGASAAWAVV